MKPEEYEGEMIDPRGPDETLEQIAERLAPPHSEVCRSHASGVCDCWRTRQRIAILAALREVEARGEQRAAALGGALLDSAKERAEKAESNLIALRIAEAEAMSLVLSHEGHIAKLEAKLVENDALQADYQRIISAVLDCDPIPASNRPDDDRLEPPWDVIRRVLAERDAAIKELADIIENDEGQRERANRAEVEVERLRTALAEALSQLNGATRRGPSPQELNEMT